MVFIFPVRYVNVYQAGSKSPDTLWWTNILPWKDPPFLMGKSTISMAIFHCYVSSPEGTAKAPSVMLPTGADGPEAFASPLLPSAFQQLHAETGVERARRRERVGVAGKGCLCELGINGIRKLGSIWFYDIWVNYNDLTATSLESWLVRGIIPQWLYFRLVKYYNLPRWYSMNDLLSSCTGAKLPRNHVQESSQEKLKWAWCIPPSYVFFFIEKLRIHR